MESLVGAKATALLLRTWCNGVKEKPFTEVAAKRKRAEELNFMVLSCFQTEFVTALFAAFDHVRNFWGPPRHPPRQMKDATQLIYCQQL